MDQLMPLDRIEKRIHLLRGQKVMLADDLAQLYGISVSALNQAVRRNLSRFPEDFMFQLSTSEGESLKSQIVISKSGRGGRRHLPYAFTEQGVAMLSSVLRSERAVQVNIAIMRAFVQLRGMISSHKDLVRRLDALEQKYDARFRVVFDAIRALMEPPAGGTRQIGFARDTK